MIRVVGSASRASAAGSFTTVRATTRPMAAAAIAAGTVGVHIATNWPRSTRPSETLMTAKMQALPTRLALRTAARAASQYQVWAIGALRIEYTAVATVPVSADSAVLRATFSPRGGGCPPGAAATPTTWATTRSLGVVST